MPTICLLTDFGSKDPYVGIMKGVLRARAPTAQLIDLTSEIEPGDIGAASFWLARSAPYFPDGAIFLAVVDPGVGTLRRAVAAKIGPHLFVAPDNGLLTDVLALANPSDDPGDAHAVNVVEIPVDRFGMPLGATFHGRDVFAPAAAHLAMSDFASLGSAINPAELYRAPFQDKAHGRICIDGQPLTIRVIDRFGNLISDHAASSARPTLTIDGAPIEWVTTYAEAQPGQLVALAGSFRTIEVALNQASAQAALGLD